MTSAQLAARLVNVHVTGGPTPWDYVVGGGTIAAVVAAVVALTFAAKAGSDLVHDRRQTFELSILLEIYRLTEAYSGPDVVRVHASLLPRDELPTLREKLRDPNSTWTDPERTTLRSEIETAINERTS
jgi:hypothetical protein